MRDHFATDWAFALQGALATEAEQHSPADVHRWPLLRAFSATAYQWCNGWLLLSLVDRATGGTPTISGSPVARECPVETPRTPTPGEVLALAREVTVTLSLRPQDALVFIPVIGESTNLETDWELFDETRRTIWQVQLTDIVTRHFYWLKGLDVSGGFFLPPGYTGMADACALFLAEHPDYERNVFIMTRFDSTGYLTDLDSSLRSALRANGLNPLRADDRVYPRDRNLWDNVCVYMICCNMGVAVLEDRGRDEFNPNVGIEYGFMRALNKPTLLLADIGFRNLRADVIGTLREQFDLLSMGDTIPAAIDRWLRDLGHVR